MVVTHINILEPILGRFMFNNPEADDMSDSEVESTGETEADVERIATGCLAEAAAAAVELTTALTLSLLSLYLDVELQRCRYSFFGSFFNISSVFGFIKESGVTGLTLLGST